MQIYTPPSHPFPCATQAPAVPTRLPRSITACTYKHHMHTHIRMHLYIDASPCQALYVPLNPTPCTHMCASLTHLPLCPHRPLLCLPHSIGACTHDYHMCIDIDMSLPIDASPTNALTHPWPYTVHIFVPHSQPYPHIYRHRPLPCLPHSITAHMHDHHMPTHMAMHLPIDALPSLTPYAPLGVHDAHICASLTPLPLCLHRPYHVPDVHMLT